MSIRINGRSREYEISADFAGIIADKPVVFLFPGIGGRRNELDPFSTGCASDLQMVLIPLPDWVRVDYDLINLDGLVKYSIAQIERYGHRGPVLLAGYSFGGHVAVAVAAALQASGHHIGCLALLDTAADQPVETLPMSITRPGRRLVFAVRNRTVGAELARIAGAIIMRFKSKKLSRLVGRLPLSKFPRSIAESLENSITMSFNIPILAERLAQLAETNDRFRFPAVLFRCAQQNTPSTDDLGWGRHLSNLRVVPILGDHLSLLSDPEILLALCASFTAVMTDAHQQIAAEVS